MAPQPDFENLTHFIDSISSTLPAYALVDRADGVGELFLKSGGLLMFDDSEDLDTVSADISALAANSPIFSYGSKLQYLDLRLGDKAFYKLVGNTGTTTPAT